MAKPKEQVTVGWREWIGLPGLGLPAVKTKVDTGAKTSTLHAFELESFMDRGQPKVRFVIHPLQKRTDIRVECIAPIIDTRVVSDSGGHREKRPVIKTIIQAGEYFWPIELTLTNRDTMLFRMLLGRAAMGSSLIVDPSASYLLGSKPPSLVRTYKRLLAKKR